MSTNPCPVPKLKPGSLMEQITGSSHPGDALMAADGMLAFLRHSVLQWAPTVGPEMSMEVPLTNREADGLALILGIVREAVDEAYEALTGDAP